MQLPTLFPESRLFFNSQNLVSPSSKKLAKFQIGGNGFLDLSWLYFAFDLTNNHGSAALTPLAVEPHCLFKRLIVRVGSGTLVESLERHNVAEEFVRRLLPHEKLNLAGMFLGANTTTGVNGYELEANPLAAGATKRVLYRPMTSGMLNLKEYWPALLSGAQGLTFELELPQAAEAVLGSGSQDYTLSNLRTCSMP
jgi:hypothetical protein